LLADCHEADTGDVSGAEYPNRSAIPGLHCSMTRRCAGTLLAVFISIRAQKTSMNLRECESTRTLPSCLAGSAGATAAIMEVTPGAGPLRAAGGPERDANMGG
jgi:hypothetical protein